MTAPKLCLVPSRLLLRRRGSNPTVAPFFCKPCPCYRSSAAMDAEPQRIRPPPVPLLRIWCSTPLPCTYGLPLVVVADGLLNLSIAKSHRAAPVQPLLRAEEEDASFSAR